MITTMMTDKMYTDEEEQYIKDHYQAMSDEEIAEHLGRTASGIKQHRIKMMVEKRKASRFTPQEDNILRRWYRTKTNIELAEMLEGKTNKNVCRRIKELNLKRR